YRPALAVRERPRVSTLRALSSLRSGQSRTLTHTRTATLRPHFNYAHPAAISATSNSSTLARFRCVRTGLRGASRARIATRGGAGRQARASVGCRVLVGVQLSVRRAGRAAPSPPSLPTSVVSVQERAAWRAVDERVRAPVQTYLGRREQGGAGVRIEARRTVRV